MYLGCGHQPAVLLAHLAERVSREECCADLYPVAAVTLFGFRVTTIAFVTLVLLLGMFLTESAIC